MDKEKLENLLDQIRSDFHKIQEKENKTYDDLRTFYENMRYNMAIYSSYKDYDKV
jgi:hypothetical protein